MIAPIRESESRRRSPELLHARRLIASTLLGHDADPTDDAPPVARWRAWLYTAWAAAVAAIYFACMAGLL